MDALGWSQLKCSPGFAVRVESSSEHQTVYLTDLASLWCERLTADEILKRCQEINPLVESRAENLIQQLTRFLKTNDSDLVTEKAGQDVIITLKSKLDILPFSWKFQPKLQSSDEFQMYVTKPLLAMLQEATSIQEELCNVIRTKDKEIDDYKASGATVSRRQLATKEFNKEAFFTERRWRTLDESVEKDAVTLFCETASGLDGLYQGVVSRIVSEKEKAVELVKPAQGPLEANNHSAEETDLKKKPSTAEEEAIRLANLRKRLMEEQVKEHAKQATPTKLRRVITNARNSCDGLAPRLVPAEEEEEASEEQLMEEQAEAQANEATATQQEIRVKQTPRKSCGGVAPRRTPSMEEQQLGWLETRRNRSIAPAEAHQNGTTQLKPNKTKQTARKSFR